MYKPTGTNVTPLGTKRRFADAGDRKESPPPQSPNALPAMPSPSSTVATDGSTPKRKRKSRWGDEQQKVIIPGLPTSISKHNRDQSDKYLY
ncbi:hypothetical protein BD560DRAFT_210500 [Blakeslea trispora]|nr:hypothetical protein BD560DRAFT_210500 [Blakeslea trispora]